MRTAILNAVHRRLHHTAAHAGIRGPQNTPEAVNNKMIGLELGLARSQPPQPALKRHRAAADNQVCIAALYDQHDRACNKQQAMPAGDMGRNAPMPVLLSLQETGQSREAVEASSVAPVAVVHAGARARPLLLPWAVSHSRSRSRHPTVLRAAAGAPSGQRAAMARLLGRMPQGPPPRAKHVWPWAEVYTVCTGKRTRVGACADACRDGARRGCRLCSSSPWRAAPNGARRSRGQGPHGRRGRR